MDRRGKETLQRSNSQSSPSLTTSLTLEMKKTLSNRSNLSSARGKKRSPQKRFDAFKRSIIPNPEKSSSQRKPYLIQEKGVQRTPQALYDPEFPSASDKLYTGLPAAKPLHMTRSGRLQEPTSSRTSMASLQSHYSISKRSRGSLAPSTISMGVSFAEASCVSLTEVMPPDEEEVEIEDDEKAPSLFRMREDPPPREQVIETKFTVRLSETDTMFLLQIPTSANPLDSETGVEIAGMNTAYDRVKQTSRTISHTATQTKILVQKHQKTHIPRALRTNSSAYVTIWDIYDTMDDAVKASIVTHMSREEGQVCSVVTETAAEDETQYFGEFEYLGSKFNRKLLNSLMIMERLIQKERFKQKQVLFQGLFLEDPFSLNVNFNYNFTHLWTFKTELATGRRVTTMCWNPKNGHILAVGYGKFKYVDKCNGLVCIWNVKNPKDPERHYEFEESVTHVTFSSFRAQILAVCFYNGLVLLVDIISRSLLIKANNAHYPLFYPVWQSLFQVEENSCNQNLLTCSKNGQVYKYKKTKFFVSKKIMSMARPHGNIQGVEQPRKCFGRKTLASRNPSAEVLAAHPSDPSLYLVGTAEGCVYSCSVNHRHDHLDVFVAHNGPIYGIQYNPFCHKVFLTCGADWCIRIWAEGIFEPLITLETGMNAVQAALWDPLHSTIILSITGTNIQVWDIRRRTSLPKSSHQSPSGDHNTVLQFTTNKYNLCVGDVGGNVHVLALTEMPFSPAYQDLVLAQSIRNALVTQPELLDKLERLGHPFTVEERSDRQRMYRRLGKLQQDA